MSKRIEWIDSAKGFGIFLVTLGHLYPNPYLERYIYSFHMFLFFFISGYLYRRHEIKETVKKKTMSLLVPFIVHGGGIFFDNYRQRWCYSYHT